VRRERAARATHRLAGPQREAAAVELCGRPDQGVEEAAADAILRGGAGGAERAGVCPGGPSRMRVCASLPHQRQRNAARRRRRGRGWSFPPHSGPKTPTHRAGAGSEVEPARLAGGGVVSGVISIPRALGGAVLLLLLLGLGSPRRAAFLRFSGLLPPAAHPSAGERAAAGSPRRRLLVSRSGFWF
jgi:hypothetical protein